MIRRARRDGREARGNEELEKREDEKGSHCFFKSSKGSVTRQKLQNSKVYAKSPKFSPALGLIIFGKKSVATKLR